MNRLNLNQVRCEALFASGLQRADVRTAAALTEVIGDTVRQLGVGGCAGLMAREFGDHPEPAAERMRWIRQLVGEVFPVRARPAAREAPVPGTPAAGAGESALHAA
jgi:hypothetical protein